MRRLLVIGLVGAGIWYVAKSWGWLGGPQEPGAFAGRPEQPVEPLDLEGGTRGTVAAATKEDEAAAQAVERPSTRPDPGSDGEENDGSERASEAAQAKDWGSVDFEPEASQAPEEDFEFTELDVDALALPLCLLEAWQANDSGKLSTFLNDGAGSELPTARRKLMLAFWRALRGDQTTAGQLLDEIEGDTAVTTAQLDLARRAMGQRGPVKATMSSIQSDPLARAMRMVLGAVDVEAAYRAADTARMAKGLSDLLLFEVHAPWEPRREVLKAWAKDLATAQKGHRLDPSGDWDFIEYTVQGGDNLQLIRKRVMQLNPGLNVCVGLIRESNRLGTYIHEDQVLRIPKAKVSVIVDLDARILLYLHDDEVVLAWDVGIGKPGQETPIGDWTVGEKLEDPAYMPVGLDNLPFGHPDNPLGSRWLGLYRGGNKTSYGIHGTGDPDGVGDRVSKGCVRMRNEEVDVLFDLLPLGSEVRIQP